MLFSSTVFLLAFLPATLVVYFLVPQKHIKAKNLILLVASLIFYGWGEPKYILVMLASILFNYIMAIGIGKYRTKGLLALCVAGNLGILGFFKYTNFVIETINGMFGGGLGLLNIALPIGISFYTFQTMSYVIDVYRGKVAVQKDFIALAAYVTLFPQLIAGPIVRYSDVMDQLEMRKTQAEQVTEGIRRFIIGLGKKILLANQVAVVWTAVSSSGEIGVLTAWMGALCFTFQIYFDFSGYSDMAIGLGKIFGFDYLENFNYPYISSSITEFWRRWHMSLSSWFKEYLYVPLGGNRKGLTRQIINIAIVWALTGLWHGASWNFLLWGVYYGILLIIEKAGLLEFLKKHKVVGTIYTLVIVIIGWVFFSTEDMGQAFEYIKMMFGSGGALIDNQFLYFANGRIWLFLACVVGSTPLPTMMAKQARENLKGKALFYNLIETAVLLVIFMLCISFLVSGSYNPFLYFRF